VEKLHSNCATGAWPKPAFLPLILQPVYASPSPSRAQAVRQQGRALSCATFDVKSGVKYGGIGLRRMRQTTFVALRVAGI
jgi:hypothetical protein